MLVPHRGMKMCFAPETLYLVLICFEAIQHFKSDSTIRTNVLPQVDVGIASLPNLPDQAIPAKLLPLQDYSMKSILLAPCCIPFGLAAYLPTGVRRIRPDQYSVRMLNHTMYRFVYGCQVTLRIAYALRRQHIIR
jgi:hypothetical protein